MALLIIHSTWYRESQPRTSIEEGFEPETLKACVSWYLSYVVHIATES